MTRSQKELIGSLVIAHWDKLAQLAYRKTGDVELSKDLAQEVILTACVKIRELEKHPLPLAWCYSTLNNLIMREHKKAYRANEIVTDEIYPLIQPVNELSLDDCLPDNLSPAERELIILRMEEGLSTAQIAQMKGISNVACRKQLSRAYEKCRKFFKKENY